ncbi:aconitase X catalytic domain-containing protein [Dasania marina]|uniref:aconitase X catalytic domain-containing protein n=1 Tax=Dasania marina TaxID=471499 RepID=UPI0030DDB405|tara:strand:+ start:67941 stop:69158 length:1218 start_codon:yes stop_codon:yes gene_type:complete
MKLTSYEQDMLAGKHGKGAAKALGYQVQLGEAFNASCMVEIERVHAPLTHLGGDNWFVSDLLKDGARLNVIATTNPIYDAEYFDKIDDPEPEENKKLVADVKARFLEIGLNPSYNCTPQLEANVPRFNEIVAFSESSAVPYVNGILGARSNRESAKSALAAAITGRVPLHGLLLDENRKGNVHIKVEAKLKDAFDYRLLGFVCGKKMGNGIPVFEGLPDKPKPEELLNLCTDLNVSAAVAMLHIVGFTPEAPDLASAFGGKKPDRTITVSQQDLDRLRQDMSDFHKGKFDFVMLGCAHYSLEQIKLVAHLLHGKHIANGIELWILSSPQTRSSAEQMGYLTTIEAAGGHIVGGSCSDMPVWDRRLSGKRGLTDSLKAKFYNSVKDIDFKVMPLEQCITAAIAGEC